MKNHYKVRCVCEKCERKQMRAVEDLITGAKCAMQSIKTPPCGGTLNYYSDTSEDAILNMGAVMGYLNAQQLFKSNPRLAELVDTVVDDVGHWMEGEPTPQQMGWVDSKGRP